MTTLHRATRRSRGRTALALVGLVGTRSGSACSLYPVDASGVVTGTWSTDQPAGAGLTLLPAGKVTGCDGCNSLTATWSAAQRGVITLAELSAKSMFCEGVDTWLAKAF